MCLFRFTARTVLAWKKKKVSRVIEVNYTTISLKQNGLSPRARCISIFNYLLDSSLDL